MNSNSNQKQPLLTQILEFQKIRVWLIVPLMLLGLTGLLLPFLPGLALLFAGLMLWKPETAEKISAEVKRIYRNFTS